MNTNADLATPAGALVFLGTFTGGYEVYTNVNLAAPVGALAFLATGLIFLITTIIFGGSWIKTFVRWRQGMHLQKLGTLLRKRRAS